MKNRFCISFLVIFSVLLFASCGDNGKVVSEGVIEFDAKVVDLSHPMASMAPTKMTFKFKDNFSIVEMSAGMGFLYTSFITNPEEKTLTQFVKMFGKKFAVIQKVADLKIENDKYPLEFTSTNETKVIAGYTCTKVHVKVKNETNEEFDVFYTKEISIENSNFTNPYSEIDGVLMEYQMKKFGIEMRFTAKTVSKIEVGDDLFKFDKESKIINQEEMDEMFLNMM